VQSLVLRDPMEAAGVNDRAQLAVAEAELRDRINERWMRRGVTMWDPERTYVDAHVELAPDVSLLPGVILRGRCVVGEGTEIGPNCLLTDTTVGQRATVSESICDRSVIGDGAEIGPYCVLRPGAEVLPGAVIQPHTVIEPPEG
jgi:bifunctional UDP-N-acetylglucosamine pyrophosphorylase/glucosamine-1-phosphate N-acetyltransferase